MLSGLLKENGTLANELDRKYLLKISNVLYVCALKIPNRSRKARAEQMALRPPWSRKALWSALRMTNSSLVTVDGDIAVY